MGVTVNNVNDIPDFDMDVVENSNLPVEEKEVFISIQ